MLVTTRDIRAKKKTGETLVMVTAYDAPTARIVDEAGVDMILVGDSVGTNVLGLDSETRVTLDDVIHHARAVARSAAKRAASRRSALYDLPRVHRAGAGRVGAHGPGRTHAGRQARRRSGGCRESRGDNHGRDSGDGSRRTHTAVRKRVGRIPGRRAGTRRERGP